MNAYEYYEATEDGNSIYFRLNIVTGMVQVFTDVGEWFDQPHLPLETLRWAYTPEEGEDLSFSRVESGKLPGGVTP